MVFALPAYANTETEDVFDYQGIMCSESITAEQLESLSQPIKEILRAEQGLVLNIINTDNNVQDLLTRGIIPSWAASGQLVVRRTSDPNFIEFLLTVTRESSSITSVYTDKIALSWGGGCALASDWCGIQTSPGGSYVNVRVQRAEVSSNQGVSYHLNPNGSETSYLLRATIDNRNSGSQSKNVVGGYARKTWGFTGISTSFGLGTISFGATMGTTWDEMSPVYSRFV